MRISTPSLVQTSVTAIDGALERFADAQQRVSTGRRLSKPSDDPAGLSQSLGLHSLLSNMDTYKSNIVTAKAFLDTTDNALGNALNILRQVRTTAVQAATSSVDPSARAALAAQITDAIGQLATVGNSTYGQKYVFSGQRTTTKPFQSGADGYEYHGGTQANGDDALYAEIDRNNVVQINVTGDTIFNSAFTALTNLANHVAGGQVTQISNDDLAAMDNVISKVLSARADAGAKSQNMTHMSTRIDQSSNVLTQVVSNIEDADIATAVVDMNTAQLAYQAALSAGSKSLSISLLDFLR